jgi:hypothetical protein
MSLTDSEGLACVYIDSFGSVSVSNFEGDAVYQPACQGKGGTYEDGYFDPDSVQNVLFSDTLSTVGYTYVNSNGITMYVYGGQIYPTLLSSSLAWLNNNNMYSLATTYSGNNMFSPQSYGFSLRYGPPQAPVHNVVPGLWTYGNFCGAGGSGTPIDDLDDACAHHDMCYYTHGNLTASSNSGPDNPELQACNQTLCDAARNVESAGGSNASDAWEIRMYFSNGAFGGNACH